MFWVIVTRAIITFMHQSCTNFCFNVFPINFDMLCFYFHSPEILSNFPVISSLFFRNMFNFYIFVTTTFFLLLISNYFSVVGEYTLNVFNPLSSLRIVLGPHRQYILENVSCVLEKNACSVVVWWNVL